MADDEDVLASLSTSDFTSVSGADYSEASTPGMDSMSHRMDSLEAKLISIQTTLEKLVVNLIESQVHVQRPVAVSSEFRVYISQKRQADQESPHGAAPGEQLRPTLCVWRQVDVPCTTASWRQSQRANVDFKLHNDPLMNITNAKQAASQRRPRRSAPTSTSSCSALLPWGNPRISGLQNTGPSQLIRRAIPADYAI